MAEFLAVSIWASVAACKASATNFTMPSGKLMIATLDLNGFKAIDDFLDRGYDPEYAGANAVYAQFGEDILHAAVDKDGDVEEAFFIRGFAPRAQRNGTGMSYQTTPYPLKDFWTGAPEGGSLVIRWAPGTVDIIDDAYDAVWSPDGQVLATVRNETSGNEDTILVTGPGSRRRCWPPMPATWPRTRAMPLPRCRMPTMVFVWFPTIVRWTCASPVAATARSGTTMAVVC